MTHDRNDLDFPDEVTGSRLALVLRAEVETVEPAAGSLALIQARAATARPPASPWRWAAPLAAAAVVATIAVGAVLAPSDGPTTTTPPGTSLSPSPTEVPSLTPSPTVTASTPTPSTSTSSSGTGQPDPSSSGGTSGTACVGAGDSGYAYFASDLNGRGPRLYRGTIVISCHLGIEESLTVPATKDPDFTSLWPAGTTVRSLKVNGNVATVDLDTFPSGSAELETAAVQQLVWTVTANRNSISSVRLLVNGAPPVGARDWSSPVRRANAFATLSNVWIISPGNGATVGSPLTVRVYGTGYEGQVPLKVFQDGAEVASTSVTTEQGAFAEATATFDLPPGTYEVRAYNDNGQDDSLELWDTKVVVIS